jgi:CBS domain-containing protein
MTPVEAGRAIEPNTGLWTALKNMELSGLSLLPVVDNGELMGIARRDDIFLFLSQQRPTGPRLIRL